MILNISGRTDIVAFYSEWLVNRFEEGYVDCRNPFYSQQVTRYMLNPQTIDLIVIATKNPLPLFPHLEKFRMYPLLFQVTLTPYGTDIEPGVPNKRDILKGIQWLSQKLGHDHVMVRYDPILLSSKYTIFYHEKAFRHLCASLSGFVDTIIFSFLDLKKNTVKHQQEMQLLPITAYDMQTIASIFSQIAKEYHISLQTCAEEVDLTCYGIFNRGCISSSIVDRLTGYHKDYPKGNTRKNCPCLKSVDIGVYNTCPHRCKYCYANYDEDQIRENVTNHCKTSSFLIGKRQKDDILKIKRETDTKQEPRQMFFPL